MPLDGLSFSNSGLYRITTPIEIAFQAEQIAQSKAETVIKEIDKSAETNSDIEEKDKDQSTDLEGREIGDDSDNDEGKGEEEKSFLEKKENVKKYKVKFNQLTDKVELIDLTTGLVIETITPDDLINIISKSRDASGVLVDKEI